MGKKIAAEMEAQRATFVEGAAKNGIQEGMANTIFDAVAKFASYGFNKSHAAAYALLAYHTAYLKANHPLEFYRGGDDHGDGEPGEARGLSPRDARPGHRAAATRRERVAADLFGGRPADRRCSRVSRRPLRLGRHQGGRPGGDAGSGRRADGARPVQEPLRPHPPDGRQGLQPPAAGGTGQGRCARWPG